MRVYRSLKARIGEKYQGGTCNLSDTGMLMMTDAVFECGAAIDILLQTPENREIPLRGRVIRTADSCCTPAQAISTKEKMKNFAGIQLLCPPPEYYSLVDSLVL